ncbi:hypothetical protein [Spirosoma sp. KCTC 42546]|uniref:hypothetical protein n=1 Tax=Spirosoma sp. KCTC 42546 TaxID=2520506 RepID=UPI00143D9550|nr:hypothetical protein [Spirosoma sp. KCTC 42546]
MMTSLASFTPIEISRQKELTDSVYINLLTLQKNLTLEVAATASTVAQVTQVHGEQTVAKLVCAILKLFNDGLNTTLQMGARQLLEYANIWTETFSNETIKDLILCLKRVKAGRYGPIFNRVDGTVISDFFRKYLEEKADWLADSKVKLKAQQAKSGNDLLTVLSTATDNVEAKQQLEKIRKLTLKGKLLKTPVIDYGPYKSDATYTKFIGENAQTIAFEDLIDVKKRAKAQNLEEVYDIATAEINRRATQLDQEYRDYKNEGVTNTPQ